MPALGRVLAGALAATVLIAGCASVTDGTLVGRSGSSSGLPSSGTQSPGSDVTATLAAARDYLLDENHPFEMKGPAQFDGAPGTVDLRFGPNYGQGEVTMHGGRLQVMSVGGTIYVKGDAVFWMYASPDHGASIIAAAGDKWISGAEGDQGFQGFGEFATRDGFAGALFAAKPGTSTSDPATVGGVPCTTLIGPSGGRVFLAADDSRPIQITKADVEKLEFTYGTQPAPTAPDPSDVIPASELDH